MLRIDVQLPVRGWEQGFGVILAPAPKAAVPRKGTTSCGPVLLAPSLALSGHITNHIVDSLATNNLCRGAVSGDESLNGIVLGWTIASDMND